MSGSVDTRRAFLRRAAAVGPIAGVAGCTAVGAVEATLVVENTGLRDERTEYYVDRGETATDPKTVELGPMREHTDTVQIERTDSIVVSKGDLGFELALSDYVCRNPVVTIDTGFGMLGVSGECFDTSPQ